MTHKTGRPQNPFSRCRDALKRLFSKTPSRNPHPIYERSFSRFPMEFKVNVDLKNKEGAAFTDAAELRDVSGSGALFVSKMAQHYYVGQTVFLTIYLAGTSDVGACVRVKSTVVRTQSMGNGSFDDATGKTGIAVRFNETFAFERMDNTANGDL